MDNLDFLFKVCVTGDWGVGKTSIVLRFVEDDFLETPQETLGVDFRSKSVKVRGVTVRLKVCDTAGQERFKAITSSFYRGAQAVIFVFDPVEPESLSNIPHWVDEASRYAVDDADKFLVMNKIDLPEEKRRISMCTQKGEEISEQMDMEFLQVSAKTAEGIDELFQKVAAAILKRKMSSEEELIPTSTRGRAESVTVSHPRNKKRTKKLCLV